ncbi:VHS-domain-containing protein [Piedraia hortae CBS 480.64]|uniref:VHS-domain-containing protein n=1 Tax=Piedraia hortae CBS 480.64 TaxID=1314780 RepID=A0A6A7C9G8_9PEZI|nr:VHS-domain-containing protein [Piedraia hortae CBS 480.64]
MEAAAARHAARDRFAYPIEPPQTPLQRLIKNACSPENYEPNLALALEIAELINEKKGSAPREAAMAIISYINHRNPNISMLALSLLDICVKNCGYPFHLQISTKEFLNELVRRFPERPPLRTTRVQNRILELIGEWRWTICETSKYKEDLGYIRDMHRLLGMKGYVFPEVRKEDAAVLNPSDNLRSAEEMEAEEREAQSAKLQELIRRGTPQDLQEANRLMKVMAGYDNRRKTDYRAKAAEEVGKVQQKARLLEEMLQTQSELKEGDVAEELAAALASAHPKIQKMCEEESDDREAVAKLLEINDSIHRTVERYRLVKKGDVGAANSIPKGTLGVSGAGVSAGPGQELSLIDLGGEDTPAPQPTPGGSTLANDLLGLSMDDSQPSGNSGSHSLNDTSARNASIMAQFNSKPATGLSPTKLPAAPWSSGSTLDLLDIGTGSAALQATPQVASQSATPTNNDDEWTFSSSLPDQPATIEVTPSTSHIRIEFNVSRTSDTTLQILSSISNKTDQNIKELALQLAVTKGYTLQLQPQSSLTLAPRQVKGITQTIQVQNVERGTGTKVKMRWKVGYNLGGMPMNEQGEVVGMGVM